MAGVNDESASNLIITLTEVEHEEGPGLGLFSCHGGVFGACYPEVCACGWVGSEGRKGVKDGRFEPHADQPLVPRSPNPLCSGHQPREPGRDLRGRPGGEPRGQAYQVRRGGLVSAFVMWCSQPLVYIVTKTAVDTSPKRSSYLHAPTHSIPPHSISHDIADGGSIAGFLLAWALASTGQPFPPAVHDRAVLREVRVRSLGG